MTNSCLCLQVCSRRQVRASKLTQATSRKQAHTSLAQPHTFATFSIEYSIYIYFIHTYTDTYMSAQNDFVVGLPPYDKSTCKQATLLHGAMLVQSADRFKQHLLQVNSVTCLKKKASSLQLNKTVQERRIEKEYKTSPKRNRRNVTNSVSPRCHTRKSRTQTSKPVPPAKKNVRSPKIQAGHCFVKRYKMNAFI